MRFLIDTNIIIFVLKDRSGVAARRLAAERVPDVAICAIVEAELYHGATKYDSPPKRRIVLDGFLKPYWSLPFDSACVKHYATIRDDLEGRGQLIGGNDLMIAAIALAHDLTVVTNNTSEFGRVPGLRVEDWSK